RVESEYGFGRFITEHGLPRPELNADFELAPGRWIQIDALWRDARLAVELDGRGAPDTPSRFDSDRARDRLLAGGGYRTVRVTWRHLHEDRRRLAMDLAALIATGLRS